MSDEPKYNSFTAADIERYYNGQMIAAERHALEKAALDDPFLADALEGYAFTTTPVADVKAIKERLEEKVPKRGVVPFLPKTYKWLQIAALFLVLAGAGWYLYRYSFNSKREIALSKPSRQKQKETVTNNRIADSLNAPTMETPTSTEEVTVTQTAVSSREDKSSQKKQVFKATTGNKTEHDQVASAPVINQSAPSTNNNALQTDVNENRNLAKGTLANSNKDASYNATTSARINNSKPSIENNVVKSADSSSGLVAAQGRMQGVSASHDTVHVDVVMQQSKEMNEVEVVGFGAKKKAEAAPPSARFEELEPAEGWSNFNDYVAQNLKEPQEIKEKKVSGDVELSFDVNKEGEAVNIKVEKSLCSTCDEEAIRLLKEGPKWKKKKAKKGKIAIRF